MKNFIHIVTTRFNVPTKNWYETREGKTPLTEEWHKHRFELFLNFTYPSFVNQSNKNFIWMVFFDVNTSPKYKKIISTIELEYPNFKPYFIHHGDEINENIRNWVKDYFSSETQYLISTDIDNDDVLHCDYVKTVQNHFKPIHELVIDIRRGLQISIQDLVIKSANEFYGIANPFVSFVEKVSEPYKTIMNESHPNFRHYKNIVAYDAKPMFIQIIHHYNLLNNTFKAKKISHLNTSEFGIDKNVTTNISLLEVFYSNSIKKLQTILKFMRLKNK